MKEEKGRVGNWNTGKREENEGETDAVQGHSWKKQRWIKHHVIEVRKNDRRRKKRMKFWNNESEC